MGCYHCTMAKKPLIETNTYLRDPVQYRTRLVTNVSTSTAVETGAKMGELVEIRSGPQPGEKVVLRPSAKLHDGAAVKPAGK